MNNKVSSSLEAFGLIHVPQRVLHKCTVKFLTVQWLGVAWDIPFKVNFRFLNLTSIAPKNEANWSLWLQKAMQ